MVDADGTWLSHSPIEVELAKEAILARRGRGLHAERLCRRRALRRAGDAVVAGATPRSRADDPHGRDHADWLDEAADEDRLRRRSRRAGRARGAGWSAVFDGRLTISKSLPYFLEFSAFGSHEGRRARLPRGAHRASRRTRRSASATARTTSSCSSGRAFGVAVENAHPRVKAVADWVCPPAAEEGVAAVLEALLDSRS